MTPTNPGGLVVLVVEDERIISLAMAAMLRALGHRVLACVPSGEEALEAVARQTPDLVLMDIRLEGQLDGIDTARVIRERRNTPVAFTTAYTDADRTGPWPQAPWPFCPSP